MVDIQEKTKRIIICEGEHDKNFLETLVKRRNLPDLQVFDAYACCNKGGKNGLAPALAGLYPISGFTELIGVAIVTDNDNVRSLTDLQKSLEVLEDYVSTQSPRIDKMGGITVITILIPNHNNHGSLETLCLPALFTKWPDARECTDAYLHCTGAISWGRHKLCKAIVRCIISGFYKKEPDKGLGYLFKADKALADHPCFNELSDILIRFDEIVERGSF